MPVIGIPVKMLLQRIETRLDREQLVEHLQHLGCDVEGYATMRRFGCRRCDNIAEITETENPPLLCDRCGADYKTQPNLLEPLGQSDVIRMELLAVRPDMFDPGGLARVLRHYLGEHRKPAEYTLAPPTFSVDVDVSLGEKTSYRPSIACAVVRGLALDEDVIKTVMKLQENLHWALGRDRKRASIGVYDLDTIEGPTLCYRSVEPQELRFVPLGYDETDAAATVTPKAILEAHPKGMAYARLLTAFSRYPLLADATGQVMSMPPIINSEATRVRRQTKNIFIDVTGAEDRIVQKTLNILVTSLAELDTSATLEQVTIRHPDREVITPDLSPQSVDLDVGRPQQVIGVPLDREAVKAKLIEMGHGVVDEGGDSLQVAVPAYRNDIMHPIDLVEDIAIAYGYHNIETSLVPTMTVGVPRPIQERMNVVRQAMTGLGYFEVLTLLLSSPEQQFGALRLPPSDDCVSIENPISVEQTIIRTSLLPGLLDTLGANTDHELPQFIFETGNISTLAQDRETGAVERCRVAGGGIGPKVDYGLIRSTCEALLRELGYGVRTESLDSPLFIAGRGAAVLASKDGAERDVGLAGEVHPEVLERFKLVQPTALFEINLEMLP